MATTNAIILASGSFGGALLLFAIDSVKNRMFLKKIQLPESDHPFHLLASCQGVTKRQAKVHIQELLARGYRLDEERSWSDLQSEPEEGELGVSPGKLALIECNLPVLKAFLESGCVLPLMPIHYLSYAAERSRSEIDLMVDFLLKENPDNLEGREDWEESPYHWACRMGNLSLIEALLEKGVRVACGSSGKTVFHALAEAFDEDIPSDTVKSIIRALAPHASLNQEDDFGFTPIMTAISLGKIAMVNAFIQESACLPSNAPHLICENFGLDEKLMRDFLRLFNEQEIAVNTFCPRLHMTPLQYAAYLGNTRMVSILCGMRSYIKAKNENGNALHHTLRGLIDADEESREAFPERFDPENRAKIILCLRISGADATALDAEGRKPIDLLREIKWYSCKEHQILRQAFPPSYRNTWF